MANDLTTDQQQLQSTIDELYRKLSELFPAQRDALRNALNTIQVGENQTLGMLAAADDLASAPIGDPAVLRDRLNLEEVLGALASLDTLSEAEVGDAAALRDKLGVAEVLETLGALSSLDTLSEAGIGDAAALRQALELGSAAQQPDSRYAKLAGGADANFSAMPRVGGSDIVASGSNSDGTWVRWADGTQLCHGAGSGKATGNSTSSAYGSSAGTIFYQNLAVTLPMPMINSNHLGLAAPTTRGCIGAVSFSNTRTTLTLQVQHGIDGADVPYIFYSFGRWK